MNKWRPQNWENPYLQQDETGNWINSKAYELGADAMLQALRNKQWCPFDNSIWQANFRGKIVIIP